MVFADTSSSYPYCTINLTVHTNAYDKQLGAVISQNNKTILFFSIRLINPQHIYTTTKKEPLAIFEGLKKLRGIRFGYKINVFLDNKIWHMLQT